MSERISLAELRERAERGYGWGDGAILALVEAVEAAHAVIESGALVIHEEWHEAEAALAKFDFGEQ